MIVTIDNTDVVIVEVGAVGPIGPVGPAGPPANQFRGVTYRTTSSTISFTGVTPGVFINSGITGTLDAASAVGTVAADAGVFGIKRTLAGAQPTYVVATADVSAGSPKLLAIKLALNGVPIDATECNASVNPQAIAKLHSMWLLDLAENDVISVWFANYSGGASITVARARMVLHGVP
jgi:hypothetical protein